MTLLKIVKAVAVNVSLEQPDTAQDAEPDNIKMVRFVNETGQELRRRVDWTALAKRHSIIGSGTDYEFALAPDHDRFSPGLCVTASGLPVRGGLSTDEWASIQPVEGHPRYFRVAGPKIDLYPFPASGAAVQVSYQSRNWAANKDGEPLAAMSADTDVPIIPLELLVKGAIWRFERHVGKDFSDHLSEFETMLADLARAEGGVRQP